MIWPNFSICTSWARPSSSATLWSFAALSLSSCRCSFFSSLCFALSSSLSWSISWMRFLRRSSSLLLNTKPADVSSGILRSTRYSIWCILRLTMTSIWFRACCFSFWNSVISWLMAARPISRTFCFLTSASFSLRSVSMVLVNSAISSSSSSRFSRRSHTRSYRFWSHPGGHASSPSSSSSSPSSSSSSSSPSSLSSSLSSSSPCLPPAAFFLLRLIFLLKILASCSLNISVSGTAASNSAATACLRASSCSISTRLESNLALQSLIFTRMSLRSTILAVRFSMKTTSRLSKSCRRDSS
mmetsp:Transcript_9575/g.25851  ORF Transcript_9575/g.25851 Transcript_9575/m.25851 type:complete len:299 (+) Transcript_9575:624-1520(+)